MVQPKEQDQAGAPGKNAQGGLHRFDLHTPIGDQKHRQTEQCQTPPWEDSSDSGIRWCVIRAQRNPEGEGDGLPAEECKAPPPGCKLYKKSADQRPEERRYAPKSRDSGHSPRGVASGKDDSYRHKTHGYQTAATQALKDPAGQKEGHGRCNHTQKAPEAEDKGR